MKQNERTRFYQLLKTLNNKKLKKWYKLKDLVELKNISYKSLKNMVKDIYEKNKAKGLIFKKGRRYYISYRLLDEFELKQPRKNKSHTWYSHNWESNISYTTKDYYDLEYHQELIKIIKEATPTVNYLSTIEEDKKERLHVHMLADEKHEVLKPILNKVLQFYLEDDFSLYCEKVQLRGPSVDYLTKNPQKLNY
ncbi:hypothetical protein LB465_17645 [Salegentibacter sp. LM13S]|uniref:hypothetical protein n=1 Tax=Salegentibacter lacus TaxID=2873599 RepID=UPI001CCF210A|nr:hypothetical protein [Salegentibacter lacus]MBZ9632606.1 hypothetical protein [Salegentibacter lacus]